MDLVVRISCKVVLEWFGTLRLFQTLKERRGLGSEERRDSGQRDSLLRSKGQRDSLLRSKGQRDSLGEIAPR